jgi:hypothetical protein
VKRALIFLVLAGIIGYGIFHFMKPKPAFDVDALNNKLDTLRSQAEMLEKMVDTEDLPDWLSASEEFFESMAEILEEHDGDCQETADALGELYDEYRDEHGMPSQAEIVKKMKSTKRNEQQEFAAKVALVLFRGIENAMPLIEDYCAECLEESNIFNKILR